MKQQLNGNKHSYDDQVSNNINKNGWILGRVESPLTVKKIVRKLADEGVDVRAFDPYRRRNQPDKHRQYSSKDLTVDKIVRRLDKESKGKGSSKLSKKLRDSRIDRIAAG